MDAASYGGCNMLVEQKNVAQRPAWNAGRLIEPKPSLNHRHIWAIRTRLQHDHRVRDLTMVNWRSTASCGAAISFAFGSAMSSSVER